MRVQWIGNFDERPAPEAAVVVDGRRHGQIAIAFHLFGNARVEGAHAKDVNNDLCTQPLVRCIQICGVSGMVVR